MCKFYEELYTSKSVDDNDIDNYLHTLGLDNVLSQEENIFVINFLLLKNVVLLLIISNVTSHQDLMV